MCWQAIKDEEGTLALNKYQAGNIVLIDQFVVRIPGELLTGYRREGDQNQFDDETILDNKATGAI